MAPASGGDAAVAGKWARQSADGSGNPLAMVGELAHDLKLCRAQWPLAERRHEPASLRERLALLFERYPGLRLPTRDARYAERDLGQATVSSGRDYPRGSKETVPRCATPCAAVFRKRTWANRLRKRWRKGGKH